MKRITAIPLPGGARLLAAGVTVGLWAALASCGGSGVVGSGGTGQTAGVTVGTVNGFGSVIVDGLAYDVTQATVVAQVAPGQDAPADVRLGDRVAVDLAGPGVASQVRVLPALDGLVSAVDGAGGFTVLGQAVAVNTTGVGGPVTQFGGGYLQPGDVRVGDPVEVHGLLVPTGGGSAIQATRVDKLAAAPAYLRVAGVVGQVGSGSPPSVTIGGLRIALAGATILPAGTALAVGQSVDVLALPATLASGGDGGLTLTASQLSVDAQAAVGQALRASGSVAQLDTAGQTFLLGAQVVQLAGASVAPTGTALANGQYVEVVGTAAADGSLQAVSVKVDSEQSDTSSELSGNISALVAGAGAGTFTVRGVSVDGSQAVLQGCPAGGLADGLFVQVHGTLASSGVLAKTVQCQSEPSGATVTRQGRVASANAAASSLVLTLSGGSSLTVVWTSATYFGNVTPDTLAGRVVQVEGTLAGTVLTASKIVVDE